MSLRVNFDTTNMKKAGVYAIHNITKQKYYVGKSVNVKYRVCSHISSLKSNKHFCMGLQDDFNKGDEIVIELLKVFPMLEHSSEFNINNLQYSPTYSRAFLQYYVNLKDL